MPVPPIHHLLPNTETLLLHSIPLILQHRTVNIHNTRETIAGVYNNMTHLTFSLEYTVATVVPI